MSFDPRGQLPELVGGLGQSLEKGVGLEFSQVLGFAVQITVVIIIVLLK